MEAKNFLIWLYLVLMLFSSAAQAETSCTPGVPCIQSISWQGIQRTFTFYLPKGYAINQRYYNLVIALPDASEKGADLEKNIMLGGFDRIAAKSRTIVVYPDALNNAWNDGAENTANAVDDAGFLRALINYFAINYHINPNRTYVIGMGSGGFMAYRLACESADLVTAIATVASSMPQSLLATCKPVRHVSVLMINGTEDPLLPWTGHDILSVKGEKLGTRLSVPETYEAWLKINNIQNVFTQQPYTKPKFDGTWAWTTSDKGPDGTDVVLYTIYGSGHTWPGGAQYLPKESVGNTSRNIDAGEIIWDFLISHRLVPLNVPTFPLKPKKPNSLF